MVGPTASETVARCEFVDSKLCRAGLDGSRCLKPAVTAHHGLPPRTTVIKHAQWAIRGNWELLFSRSAATKSFSERCVLWRRDVQLRRVLELICNLASFQIPTRIDLASFRCSCEA